jgi:O-methyltransferase
MRGEYRNIFVLDLRLHRFQQVRQEFFLFDTFSGVPEDLARPEELDRVRSHERYYSDCYEIAKANFAPYPNAKLVRGKVPETLARVDIGRVCYLSIDMNLVEPERAAIEYFWDKLSIGAPIVLDDYGWASYEGQKAAMDDFAASRGTQIMTLPTGQGFLIKT